MYKKTMNIPLENEIQDKIDEIIEHHYKLLKSKHSKLIEVRRSHVKSKGYLEGTPSFKSQPCIALLVPFKGAIPLGESEFEKTIDGYPTDVYETYRRRHYHPPSHRRFEHLRMGIAFETFIGKQGVNLEDDCGTVGPFIEYKYKGGDWNVGVLTCAHLAKREKDHEKASSGALKETVVCQYRNENDDFIDFGQIKWHQQDDEAGIDVALIEISDTSKGPRDGIFPHVEDAFEMYNVPLRFRSGKMEKKGNVRDTKQHAGKYVIKYGATSGLTLGKIVNQVRQGYIEIVNEDNEFSSPGDSGSTVFLVNENGCRLHTRREQAATAQSVHHLTTATKNQLAIKSKEVVPNDNFGDAVMCSCDISALGIVVSGYETARGLSKIMLIDEGLAALKASPNPYSEIRLKIFGNKQNSIPIRRM